MSCGLTSSQAFGGGKLKGENWKRMMFIFQRWESRSLLAWWGKIFSWWPFSHFQNDGVFHINPMLLCVSSNLKSVQRSYRTFWQHFWKAPPKTHGCQSHWMAMLLQGYHWLVNNVRNGLGCILADDMGLGKTLQVGPWFHRDAKERIRSQILWWMFGQFHHFSSSLVIW